MEGFTAVIGLEIHVQLATKTKIFCGCSTGFGAEPNSNTCPTCLGLPGALPVLNRQAVDFAIMAGLALNCEIAEVSKFDRKNYFYPDLPKGYQITQYDQPICRNGFVRVEDEEGEQFRVNIRRIHLEEDAGKLVHGSGVDITGSGSARVDFNRAGTPLIEIVTEPDLRSPSEARIFLATLKSILGYIGVSDCNMEEGSLRVDANVSLMPSGAGRYGTRTELKNMNSFRSLERALEYEAERQAEILLSGGSVAQETRTWDEKAGVTLMMRGKEEAEDYRYFPEPDLVPLVVDSGWIAGLQKQIGELPGEKQKRFIREYGLPAYDAAVLTLDRALADFFEEAAGEYGDRKQVSNWVMGEFLRLVNEENLRYRDVRISGRQLAEMLNLLERGIISGKIAKIVFEEMFYSGKDAAAVVQERGLIQINDESVLEAICEQVLDENPRTIEDFRAGKERAVKYLVGQVMRLTKGKANPQLTNELILWKLECFKS